MPKSWEALQIKILPGCRHQPPFSHATKWVDFIFWPDQSCYWFAAYGMWDARNRKIANSVRYVLGLNFLDGDFMCVNAWFAGES